MVKEFETEIKLSFVKSKNEAYKQSKFYGHQSPNKRLGFSTWTWPRGRLSLIWVFLELEHTIKLKLTHQYV